MFSKIIPLRALVGKGFRSAAVGRVVVVLAGVLVGWRTGANGLAAYATVVQAVTLLLPDRKVATT